MLSSLHQLHLWPNCPMMDCSAEVEQAFKEMKWEDVVSTLEAAIDDMLGDTPVPATRPSPLPPVPAGIEPKNLPQPLESLSRGYVCYTPLGTAPLTPSPLMTSPGRNARQTAPIIFPGPLYGKNTMCSCHQWPVDHSAAGAGSYLAAPPYLYNNVPVLPVVPEHMTQNMCSVGFMYNKKRKRTEQHDDDEPYIKKPLNAFMLYKKEQRPKVLAELNIKQNATINKILGERWNLLPDKEKDQYYKEAEKERLLHAQRHPNWSTSDNYGKYRKTRKRRSTSTSVTKSASADVFEAATPQTALLKLPHLQTEMILPVCNISKTDCHGVRQHDSPLEASTELVSPAAPNGTKGIEQAEPESSPAQVEPESSPAQTVIVQPPQSQPEITLPECEISKSDCRDVYESDSPPEASTELISTAAPGGPKVIEQVEPESSPAQTVIVQPPQSKMTFPENEISKPDSHVVNEPHSPPEASTELISTAAPGGTKVMEQLESSPAQTVIVQLPQSQTEMTLLVCDISKPDCHDVYQPDSLLKASTELISTAVPSGIEVVKQLEPESSNVQIVIVQLPKSQAELTLSGCDISKPDLHNFYQPDSPPEASKELISTAAPSKTKVMEHLEPESSPAQAVVLQLPQSQTKMALPECDVSVLDFADIHWLDSPAEASSEVQIVLVQLPDSEFDTAMPERHLSMLDFSDVHWPNSPAEVSSELQTVLVQLPESETETALPESHFSVLDSSDVQWLDCPAEASTELSHSAPSRTQAMVKDQLEPESLPAQTVLVQSADSPTQTPFSVCDISVPEFDYIFWPDALTVGVY